MDPYHSQRDSGNQPEPRRNFGKLQDTSGTSGGEQTPEGINNNPLRDAPDGGNPAATDRQPRYAGGFTVIPPNESRRRMNQMIAQREEESLQRWREENRPPAVHLNPERLGGSATEAGVRERQARELRCSKLQKKLKKEELDLRRRREEEAELQKKKDEARQKAERLEERRRQEEQRRRQQFSQDHLRKTESLLQRFERTALASSGATHTSSRCEEVQSEHREPRSDRDVELEHRRVNSAFLDRLQREQREKETKEDSVQGAQGASPAPADLTAQPWRPLTPQTPQTPDPERSASARPADPEPDLDWALMKLMSSFPGCSRDVLEEILDQCGGDFQQASSLLSCSLD